MRHDTTTLNCGGPLKPGLISPVELEIHSEQRAESAFEACAQYLQFVTEYPVSALQIISTSRMARADAGLVPFSVSDLIKQNVVASEDHLSTVCDQLTRTNSLHVFSPFTLMRGSLEAVTQGLYILGRRSTKEMQKRVLQIEHSDLSYAQKFASQLQIATPSESDYNDVSDVETVGRRLDLTREDVERIPNYSGLLNVVEQEYPGTLEFPAYWKLCSGVAHSKAWAMKLVTEARGPESNMQTDEPTVQVGVDQIWLARTLHAACRYHEMLRSTLVTQANGEEDHRASLFKRSMDALIVGDPTFVAHGTGA